MTTWYEAYYDLWLGGQYVWKIGELHKQYGRFFPKKADRVLFRLLTSVNKGPMIRINPHEIHCNDPEFIDDIYAGPSRKTDKYRFTGRKTLSKFFLSFSQLFLTQNSKAINGSYNPARNPSQTAWSYGKFLFQVKCPCG